MLKKLMGVGLLALAPVSVMAAGAGNAVDVYYLSGGIDAGADDDGDGYGIKGKFAFADSWFVAAEYQTVNYDDFDVDLDQLRLGVGYKHKLNEQAGLYGLAEYVDIDADGGFSENGFGLHVGLNYNVTDAFGLNARLGYVDIDLADGVEYLVGASYSLNEMFGLFADYRVTDLSADGGDLELDDLRVGVRFKF